MGLPSKLPEEQEPASVQAVSGRPAARGDLIFGAALVGLTVLTVALVVLLRAVAIPILLGAAVAYTLDPVVSRLERAHLSRTAASIFIALLLLGSLLTFLAFVLPALGSELARVPGDLRTLSREGLPTALTLGPANVRIPGWLLHPLSLLTIRTADAAEKLLPALAGFWGVALASTRTAVSFLTGGLVALVVAFYFLRDYQRLSDLAVDLIPPRHRAVVLAHLVEVDQVMAGFVRGQLTVGAILALLYTIALAASGLHLALLVGVIAGLGNLIPYVGLVSGLTLGLLLTVLHWDGPGLLIRVILCFAFLSLFENTFLAPRLVGHRVGLPAAGVIVAILAFGSLFGFVGILVAVPATALLKVALRALLQAYRASPWFA